MGIKYGQEQYSNILQETFGVVAIPIIQPVYDTHKIWSEVLQIYNAKGWSANELYKVLDSKFSICKK